MATSYKVLGQTSPTPNTLTTLYTVPTGANAVVSTLSICNQNINSTYVNVAIQPAGASLTNSQYLLYGASVALYDTMLLTLGITLAETDVVSVSSSLGNVSFQLFGSEVS